MSQATGWSVLPLSLSFGGIGEQLSKELVGPAQKAAQSAGDSIEKNIGSASDKAAKRVESARKREVKAAATVEKAEQDIMAAKSKTEQATRKVEATEKDLERVRSTAGTKVAKAESDLQKLRDSGSATVDDLAAAEEKVTQARLAGESDILKKENAVQKAQDDSVKAANGLEKANKDLENAHIGVEEAAEQLTSAQVQLEESTDDSAASMVAASEQSEKFGKTLDGLALGAAAAAAGAVAGLVSIGTEFQDMSRTIAVGTGAAGDDLRGLEESAMDLATTVPVSFDEAANAIAGLNTMTGESGPALDRLSEQVLNASNLLGEDGVSNANAFGNALSQWEIDAADGATALDGLFAVTQNYGIGLDEVTGHLNTFGSVLNNAGFSMEESAVLFGSLEKSGLSVSRIMPGLNSAFRGWAEEGLNVQETLADTVGQIESAETAQEALALATEEFGAEGAQRLTTAIRNGSFALEDFDTALGDTSGLIDETAADNRTLGESFTLFKNKALVAIEPIATELIDWLIPAMGDMVEKLEDAVDWISENEELIKGLAVGVGVAAAAFVTWRGSVLAITGAQKAFQIATALSTTGVKGLNTAMRANIFGLIATAVAGLVAGLMYFFTQTELGQEIWAKFTAFLSESWRVVSETFTEVWNTIKTAVFDAWNATVEGVRSGWDSVTGALSGAWQTVSDTFTGIWESIKTFVFDAWNAYVDQVKANWDMVTGALSAAWQGVSNFFTSVWNTIKTVVFDAFTNVVNGVKATWDTVTGALNTAWEWVKDTFSSVWNTIKTVVFDAFVNVVNSVKTTFDTVTDGIAGAWDWLKDTLHAAWLWIDDNVFGAAKTALDTLQGWFQTAVDAVGNIWEGLQEAAAKPVRFVVDTVWNNGLLRAVNAVTGFIGMDEIKPVKIDFATGGVLPGYTPGRDPYTFVEPSSGMRIGLSGGEAILRPEATRALGTGWVNSVNAAAISGGQSGVENQLMRSHFADGGVLDLGNFNMGGITNLAGGLSDIQQSHARFVGRFFPDLFNLTSAMRFTDSGHHSTGKATDWQAKDGQFASQMPTPGSKALARAIFTNFPNSAELIHHPLDGWQNLSEGAPYDFGPGTNADHGNHVHWATHSPLQFNGDDIVLTDVPGGGGGGNFIKGIWDRIVNAINPYEDDDGGWFGQVPGNFLKSAVDKVWSFIAEKAKSVFNFFTGGSGGGAEQWRDLARVALGRHGYGDEHLDAMVRQIEIESGGNPNAVNMWDSNARRGTPSGGLIQVIRPTYDRVRAAYPDAFEGLPNDHMEPLSNLTAGVGAVKLDWGGPANRWPTVDGYHLGGLAPAGQGVLHKTALEPEMVLSPKMTDAFIDWMHGTPQGESAAVVAKELSSAFAGEDWGYGELAHVLGNEEWAKAIVSGAATLGVISRDTDFIAANAELHETAQSAGRGYLETQATNLLDVVGLGGLVGMGSSLWDEHGDQAISTAQSLYGATQNPDSTASVTALGRTVHMEFNAESLDDVVRVGDIADAMNRLDGVEAKVNEKRRQPAASVTRGGVM